MLASHKLVRWLAPWGLVLAGAGWLLLAVRVGVGWASHRWRRAGGPGGGRLVLAREHGAPRAWSSLCAYVVFGTVAALEAWVRALRGERHPMWEPTRRPVSGGARDRALRARSTSGRFTSK